MSFSITDTIYCSSLLIDLTVRYRFDDTVDTKESSLLQNHFPHIYLYMKKAPLKPLFLQKASELTEILTSEILRKRPKSALPWDQLHSAPPAGYIVM